MVALSLPFQPIRADLYKPSELMSGYDSSHPESFAETSDFLIYRNFVANGGAASGDYLTTILQSLHDNSMTPRPTSPSLGEEVRGHDGRT